MKKRVITTALLAVMLLSFTGCNNEAQKQQIQSENTVEKAETSDTGEIQKSNNLESSAETIEETKEEKSEAQSSKFLEGEFTLKDIEGNEITQKIFENYELTMINIWSTTCESCIEEMPELQKLYKELPEKINLITICTDGEGELELVKNIISASKAEFKTIAGNDDLKQKILKDKNIYPTTIFVDKNTKIIGEKILGVPKSEKDLVETYKGIINRRYKSIVK